MPPTDTRMQSRSLNLKHAPSPDGVFHDAPIDLAVSPDEAYAYITNLHSLAVLDIAANVVKSTSVSVCRAPRASVPTESGRMYSISISKPFGRLTPPTTQLPVLLTSVASGSDGARAGGEFLYVTDYLDGTASVIPTAPLKPKAEGR